MSASKVESLDESTNEVSTKPVETIDCPDIGVPSNFVLRIDIGDSIVAIKTHHDIMCCTSKFIRAACNGVKLPCLDISCPDALKEADDALEIIEIYMKMIYMRHEPSTMISMKTLGIICKLDDYLDTDCGLKTIDQYLILWGPCNWGVTVDTIETYARIIFKYHKCNSRRAQALWDAIPRNDRFGVANHLHIWGLKLDLDAIAKATLLQFSFFERAANVNK